MPSPICTVDGNNTDNGVDVAASPHVVTIQLSDLAGVTSWSLTCVGTDETNDQNAITSSLVINNVSKTATFTAPGGGSALIFKSTVNNGVDTNGRTRPDWSYTFGVYVLSSYARVGAVNETTEGSIAFGWITKMNPVIRTGAGTTGPATTSVMGIVQLAGDLGGTGTTAGAPKVAGLTGVSGIAYGPSTALTFGVHPATAGTIRFDNGNSIVSRNNHNDGNINIVSTDSSDNVIFASGVAGLTVGTNATTISIGSGTTTITIGNSSTTSMSLGSSSTAITRSGSLAVQTRAVSGNLTIDTTTKDYLLLVDTTAARNITLIGSPATGRRIEIKDVSGQANTNPITIVRAGSESIEGLAANKVLQTSGGSWTLTADGSGNWWIS